MKIHRCLNRNSTWLSTHTLVWIKLHSVQHHPGSSGTGGRKIPEVPLSISGSKNTTLNKVNYTLMFFQNTQNLLPLVASSLCLTVPAPLLAKLTQEYRAALKKMTPSTRLLFCNARPSKSIITVFPPSEAIFRTICKNKTPIQ